MPASQRACRCREHLTPDEVEKFLAASKTATRNPIRDYCMMFLTFRHGLRVSELCGIKLRDINLRTKAFHIARSKGCNDVCHPLFNGEVDAISKWLVERKAMNVSPAVDTLFVSERRQPINRGTVHLMVRIIAEAAGLGHLEVHPHMLRHSCEYKLINQIDIRTIQVYLDHQSINSTIRHSKLDRKRFKGLFT
jgi:type 1 fimbriae regulatory protein FimB